MNDLLEKLDPTKQPDNVRQATAEKLAYGGALNPELGKGILQVYPKEPVEWIRRLEIKIISRLPFNPEFLPTLIELLASPKTEIRLEIATLLRDLLVRLSIEKKGEERKKLEEAVLPSLAKRLSPMEGETNHQIRVYLYTFLENCSANNQVTQIMIESLDLQDEEAYLTFTQYVQGKYPHEALKALSEIFSKAHNDVTLVHIIRAFQLNLSKDGTLTGYATSEEILQTLMRALLHGSENVRKEASTIIASRTQVAKKQKSPLPLEEEVWTACFNLYSLRLSAIAALDRDQAKLALKSLPVNPDRLLRLFDLLDRTHDELQKQNVLDLVSVHKVPETRTQILKMIREGFGKLRLEAQKTTIDAAAGFIPDPEVEGELEHLLEGKGLHSDIQTRLADKLFAGIPSLKERLLRWLRIDEKTKRPALDRFDLPVMHVMVIQAAKKFVSDPEIRAKLEELDRLETYSEAKTKIAEALRTSEEADATEAKKPAPKALPPEQVANVVLAMIEPLPKARIIFEGFSLPEGFGETQELSFGDSTQSKEMGRVSPAVGEIAKSFVKKAIQDIFSESVGELSPPIKRFKLTQDKDVITITAEK